MGLYARVDLSAFEEQANSIAGMIGDTLIDIFDGTMESFESGANENEEEQENDVEWDSMDTLDCDFSGAGSVIAEAFASTFMDTATSLCPVRTGYLRSTIDCSVGSDEVECYANAEYAQYVEYGTYKMSAQPYFEPAIEAATEVAREAGQGAIDEMASELSDVAFVVIEDAVGGIGGSSIIAIMIAMLIAMILYAIIDTLIKMFIDSLTGSLDEALNDIEIYVD